MPRKNPPTTKPKLQALTEPRKTCPFSGQDLQVVELSTGDFQVRGRGWVSTRLFQTAEQAQYAFSYNEGLPPEYQTTQQRISVKHENLFPEAEDDKKSIATKSTRRSRPGRRSPRNKQG